MGIQGLLPLLKSIQKPTHLRHFAGQTLGVDAYGWLHRGTVSCAIELAQGSPTRKHIDFAMRQVRMLIHFGVKPYVVFDGGYLPSKAHTEKERAAKRRESKKLGLELLGMKRIPEAYSELQKAIDVTPLMARELIEELKQLDVSYVVAPYEADSELAYLEIQGIISGVLSEDSDLLVFGVKCLVTKLDQYGECVMVKRADFTACREISLVGWSDKEFRLMTMLSGCDYLPGIDKMGLKTAYRLVRKHKTLDRVVRTVQFDGKMKVPVGYLDAFARAERTFLYQWVFCPEAQRLVNLHKVPTELEVESMPYIGELVDPEIAVGIATGDLDPNTKERLIISTISRQQSFSRTNIRQTPDEKQGKSITEFFKARRTPLAELDPNAFTPSPSQQGLLQSQQGVSWSASHVPPARLSALNPATATNVPLSAPQPTRRTMSVQEPQSIRKSPKRQRLCSDSTLSASMGLETATSRFFLKQSMQPSPSLRKASARKKDDFELWSDDSVAEAAAALSAAPEAVTVKETPSPKKRKKIKIFTDPKPAEADQTSHIEPQDAASSPTPIPAMHKESITAPIDDNASRALSKEVQEHQTESTVFSKGIDASFAALKSRFSFHSASPPKTVSRTKSAPVAARIPLQSVQQNSVLRRPPMSSSPEGQEQTRDEVLQPDGKQRHTDMERIPMSSPIADSKAINDDGIEDDEWFAIERQDVGRRSEVLVQGSEDFMVPNSPASAEDESSSRPVLNLGKFAFAG